MPEFGGLWKHENNQHALVPRRRNVAAQVAEELKTVTHATHPMEERRRKQTEKKKERKVKRELNQRAVPTVSPQASYSKRKATC